MAKKSNEKKALEYWANRYEKIKNKLQISEQKLFLKMSNFYNEQAKELEQKISDYYAEYGTMDVIEFRQLMVRLTDDEIRQLFEDFEGLVEKYPEAGKYFKIRESIYKLNRLEGLQTSILIQQIAIAAKEEYELQKHFNKMAELWAKPYDSVKNYSSAFNIIDSDMVKKFAGRKWYDNKSFSDRIWKNKKELSNVLQSTVFNGFARGDDFRTISKEVSRIMQDVSINNVKRLVFTEGTYLMNEAAITPFEGVYEKYIYEIVDGRACPVCKALSGTKHKLSERMPGRNFPPMHPWCRCTFTIDIDSMSEVR